MLEWLREILWTEPKDAMQAAMSVGSLAVTLYFWFMRANRERVQVKVYPVNGLEGTLEEGGVGCWTGRLFFANASILPTAIVAAKAELWWDGQWLSGAFHVGAGSELPWNLPPTQVFPKDVVAAFDLGKCSKRERVYAEQKLRFTFVTVEGCRIVVEVNSGASLASLAA